MAEIKDNDEYEFTELDPLESEVLEESAGSEETKKRPLQQTNVRRNALITIGVVVVIMLLYTFISSYFSATTKVEQSKISEPPKPQPVQVQQVKVEEAPTAPPAETNISSAAENSLDQKLSSMDLTQQNIRSDITAMNTQIESINSNISTLSSKFTALNQNLTELVVKLEQQTAQARAMVIKRERPKKLVLRGRKIIAPTAIYYIQALIPGRAWLISSNGSTLTVREGSNILGYGVVKLIDPNQGRVVTSSGKIIRFSPQDS